MVSGGSLSLPKRGCCSVWLTVAAVPAACLQPTKRSHLGWHAQTRWPPLSLSPPAPCRRHSGCQSNRLHGPQRRWRRHSLRGRAWGVGLGESSGLAGRLRLVTQAAEAAAYWRHAPPASPVSPMAAPPPAAPPRPAMPTRCAGWHTFLLGFQAFSPHQRMRVVAGLRGLACASHVAACDAAHGLRHGPAARPSHRHTPCSAEPGKADRQASSRWHAHAEASGLWLSWLTAAALGSAVRDRGAVVRPAPHTCQISSRPLSRVGLAAGGGSRALGLLRWLRLPGAAPPPNAALGWHENAPLEALLAAHLGARLSGARLVHGAEPG